MNPLKPVTVKDLIAHLHSFPADLPIAFNLYSELCLLKLKEIDIQEHCIPRTDGWIARKRPDKPFCQYLVFPGN
jgi:hypothetical protein